MSLLSIIAEFEKNRTRNFELDTRPGRNCLNTLDGKDYRGGNDITRFGKSSLYLRFVGIKYIFIIILFIWFGKICKEF